jgi:hypothetical protein
LATKHDHIYYRRSLIEHRATRMGEDAEGIRRRWAAWAVEVMGGDEAAAEDAARAAIHAVEAGASNAVAAVFGRMTRLPPTEADVAMLEEELRRVRRARLGLTELSLSERELERRRSYYARLDGLLAGALGQARRHARGPSTRRDARTTAAHVVAATALVVAAIALVTFHVGAGAALGIACLSLAHVIYTQRWTLAWAPAVCLTLAVLTIGRLAGMGSTAGGVVLVTMAALYTVAGTLMPRARVAIAPTAAIHLFVAGTLLPDDLVVHIAMLLAAAVLAAALAIQADRPVYFPMSLLLASAAVYWAARLRIPAVDPVGLVAVALWPLPPAVALAGLAARAVARRRWALPIYAYAGALAVAVLATGVGKLPFPAWQAALAAAAVGTWAAAAVEGWTPLALPGIAAAAGLPLAAASALHLDPVAMVGIESAAAIVITLGGFAIAPHRRGDPAASRASGSDTASSGGRQGPAPPGDARPGPGGDARAGGPADPAGAAPLLRGAGARVAGWWRPLHVGSGFGIAGATGAVCLVSPWFWQSWSVRPLVAMVPLLVLAGLFLLQTPYPRTRFLWYPATLVSSLGTVWLARFAGADNPEWYVLGPSVVIATLAVRVPHDPIVPSHPLGICRACVAFACVVPLGLTLYLSLDGDAGRYTLLLLTQAAICFACGLRFGNRALIVCGLLGAGATVIRSLAFLGLVLPPSTAAATAALVLAAAGVGAFLARHAVAQAWARLARTWQRGI